MSTNDHTTRANQHLLNATLRGALDADQNLLAAQAEATLALAEQQRVSNLISLASLVDQPTSHESLSDAAYQALDVLLGTVQTGLDDEHVVLAEDIATALGVCGDAG